MAELESLYNFEIKPLQEALAYFTMKHGDLNDVSFPKKILFTKETSIIMNGARDDNTENQILVNSLEDKNNPIRLIFAVDMLNEGWDVLNLFDIVRLYDTRQSRSEERSVAIQSKKHSYRQGCKVLSFRCGSKSRTISAKI